jgi:hypothetical protein
MLYSSALWLHSLLRWAVLLAGAVAWFRAIGGGTAKRSWTPKDELWGFLFTVSLDIQMVIGVVFYLFISPITTMGIRNLGAAMRIDTARYFTVEHAIGMIIGIALAHVGRVKIRKAANDARRHRLATIYFGLALVVICASIPWPGLAVGRPLFRF